MVFFKSKKPPIHNIQKNTSDNLDLWENNGKFHTTNTLAHFTPKNKKWIHVYLAFFATSYYQFHLETVGTEMGRGALSLEVFNYKDSFVPDFSKLSPDVIKQLGKIWTDYKDDIKTNKQDIDLEVMSILGLSEEQISDITEKLKSMVESRTKKE